METEFPVSLETFLKNHLVIITPLPPHPILANDRQWYCILETDSGVIIFLQCNGKLFLKFYRQETH